MFKTIKWRLNHARRKVEKGLKADKYKNLISYYETMLQKEHETGEKYYYEKYPKGAKKDGIKGGYKLV